MAERVRGVVEGQDRPRPLNPAGGASGGWLGRQFEEARPWLQMPAAYRE